MTYKIFDRLQLMKLNTLEKHIRVSSRFLASEKNYTASHFMCAHIMMTSLYFYYVHFDCHTNTYKCYLSLIHLKKGLFLRISRSDLSKVCPSINADMQQIFSFKNVLKIKSRFLK